MIKQIPSSSRVAIIQDPPLPSLDVPKCLSSYPTDVLKCAYSRAVGFGSAMGVRETTASKATGAPVIVLTDAICPGTGACPVVINNMIVWRDPHPSHGHLLEMARPGAGREDRRHPGWPNRAEPLGVLGSLTRIEPTAGTP
jgi:hypothetical protein